MYFYVTGKIIWGIFNEVQGKIILDCKQCMYSVRIINSRRMRWARHVARMVESRGVYRVLVGRSEVKRPLERPRRMW
jgi:hypothetical protein